MPAILLKIGHIADIPMRIEIPFAALCLGANALFAEAHHVAGAALFLLQIGFGVLRFKIKLLEYHEKKNNRDNE